MEVMALEGKNPEIMKLSKQWDNLNLKGCNVLALNQNISTPSKSALLLKMPVLPLCNNKRTVA